ncbi:MAG TPA: hypothetical protein VIJ54_12435 [Actinomycetes bacterium]
MIPTPVRPETRRTRKYGAGVSTLPLALRTLYTLALVAIGTALGLTMVKAMSLTDNRVATLVLFLIGLWGIVALLTLPHVWRPSAEWRRRQYEAHQLERRLAAAFEPRRARNANLRLLLPPCPVCGQDGPILVPSRTQCSACQRPWMARAADRQGAQTVRA